MWTPDDTTAKALTDALHRTLNKLAGAQGEEPWEAAALEALDTLGGLLLMSCPPGTWSVPDEERERLSQAAPGALRSLDGFDMHISVDAALEAAARLRLAEGDEERTALASEAIEKLGARYRLERILVGARSLLGEDLEVPMELEASIQSADEILDDEGWKLIPLGDLRRQQLAGIAPEHRAAFPWLTKGAMLPADALDSLGAAAEVLREFPGAHSYLDAMLAAEEIMAVARQPEAAPLRSLDVAGATPRSLREWVDDCIQSMFPGAAPAPQITAAAADTGHRESRLLRGALGGLVDLSWSSENVSLLLDYLEGIPRPAKDTPWFEAPNRARLHGTEGLPGRYEFPGDAPLFDAAVEDLKLHVPLQDGGVAILPFPPTLDGEDEDD